ncbi:LysM peptidoglycan-binding domain-containing protein [Brevibacterium zhoupengii]|uniref:LysM peptidoglycan-binding domain-containing protein n=1 Tax=Brevibacterium zhoupengii TaxID=2898795 RepID=UPI001E5C361A|nr:LysM domain-containing protein [Brevibacterium zhoupengii]
MYLLAACTISWLCLIGAFITTWIHLPAPRSTTDLVLLIIVGTAAMLSSRLGAVSLLTMLIRFLPRGRVRTWATGAALRIVPAVLRSSVLAVASASLTLHAAQAAPLPADPPAQEAHYAAVAAAPKAAPGSAAADVPDAALDPGWPTAVSDDPSLDPGWPTVPPPADTDPHGPGPSSPPGQDRPAVDSGAPDEDAGSGDSAPTGTDDEAGVHIVGVGESLWSIAVKQPSSGGTTHDIVDDIYSANKDVIGANPNLIMPGQRLEIQP